MSFGAKLMGVSVIIGGTSTIGEAIVKQLADEKNILLFTYFTQEARAKALAHSLQNENKLVYCQRLDATDEVSVKAFFESLRGYGNLERLVHSVGMAHYGLLEDLKITDFERLYKINVLSSVLVAKEATRLMRPCGYGNLLFISSIWGERGASNEVAYSMTKGAINSLVKALSKELSLSGIRVNAIAPAGVDSPMLDILGEEKVHLEKEMPFSSFILPEELARLAQTIFNLPSMTGEIITLDGGF